jgi:hypothetical protein
MPVRLDPDVRLVGMDGDCDVGRDRPGSRRPDQQPRIGERRSLGRKSDGDGGVLALLVLELGLRERRPVREAPPHRLQVPEEEVLRVELSERARDRRLVPEAHRQIRVVPVAADSEALELLALDVDELLRVLAAGPADRDRVHVPLLRPQLLVHLLLDGKPVAVPAGHVRGVEAQKGPAPDDAVLEDLVHGRAEVDVPVGVGRTVVEDELRPAGPRTADRTLEVHCVPGGEPFGLPPR